jgi:hypothetical protein
MKEQARQVDASIDVDDSNAKTSIQGEGADSKAGPYHTRLDIFGAVYIRLPTRL